MQQGAGGLKFIKKWGLANVLVSALKHKSPGCAGAAAAALGGIWETPGGYDLLEGSGAIPALVSAIKTATPGANLKKMGCTSLGCAHKLRSFSLFADTCGSLCLQICTGPSTSSGQNIVFVSNRLFCMWVDNTPPAEAGY